MLHGDNVVGVVVHRLAQIRHQVARVAHVEVVQWFIKGGVDNSMNEPSLCGKEVGVRAKTARFYSLVSQNCMKNRVATMSK